MVDCGNSAATQGERKRGTAVTHERHGETLYAGGA